MFPENLIDLAEAVLARARARSLTLATAESCTGGLIAGCLTEIPGSSDVVDRGFVVYSNRAKTDLLGVPMDMLVQYGAVSEEVARAMAEAARHRAASGLAVACTGIAGPGGGTAEKPVGLVHIAAARDGCATLHERCAFGDIGRTQVRMRTVEASLRLLLGLL